MIGKTNVTERNTSYRIDGLDIGVTTTHTYYPADYGLDYFDEVNLTVPDNNYIREICLGHQVNFTEAEVGAITSVPSFLMYYNAALYRVDVPSTVTYLGSYCFYSTQMRELRVDCPLLATVDSYGLASNRYCQKVYANLPLLTYTNDLFNGYEACTQFTLVSIAKMGDKFLFNARNLSHLEVPANCASVGYQALDVGSSYANTAANFHVVFTRHHIVDGSGNVTQSATTFTDGAFLNRNVNRLWIHVPLDSLLAYKRNLSSGYYNPPKLSRVFPYLECQAGDTLPATVTQSAMGWQGSYSLTWYSDKAHTTQVNTGVAPQEGRYYAIATVVSEAQEE